MKVNLVGFWDYDNYTQLTLPAFRSIIDQHFTFSFFDRHTRYDKASTVFVSDSYQYNNKNKVVIDELIDAGYLVVFENLQEMQPSMTHSQENVLQFICAKTKKPTAGIIEVPMYFWYYEHKLNNYKTISRKLEFKKKFLLMMNLVRPFRDDILTVFDDILEDSFYSYVERGIRMPGDSNTAQRWDRYINPAWYNQTQLSVAVESQMFTTPGTIFVTEKTMKPLALQHPFLMLGCRGTLALLKDAGFTTYDNLFDESYDTASDRIKLVHKQVKNYNGTGYDATTWSKLQHNHNWFYNEQEVNRRFTNDIVNPILEFVNG